MAVGNASQLAQVRLASLDDLVERLRAMADLEDGHADTRQRQQILLRFAEDFLGKDRGTG